jgi:hypothetical protein
MEKRADYSVSQRAEQDAWRVDHANYSDGVRAARTGGAGANQRELDRRPVHQERARRAGRQAGPTVPAAVGAPSSGQSGAATAFFFSMMLPAYRSR